MCVVLLVSDTLSLVGRPLLLPTPARCHCRHAACKITSTIMSCVLMLNLCFKPVSVLVYTICKLAPFHVKMHGKPFLAIASA